MSGELRIEAAHGVISGSKLVEQGQRFLVNSEMLGGIVTGSANRLGGYAAAGAFLHLPVLERAQTTAAERQVYLSASFEGASGSIIQALNAAMFVAQAGATVDFTEVNAAIAAADAAVSFNDQNITNVGSVAVDSVVVDGAATGLDIVFGGNTTKNKISLTDNLADALNVNEGGTSYVKFITTNGSEQIVVGKNSTFASTTIADLGTVTTVDLNGGTIDGVDIATSDIVVGSGKSLDVSAGTLTLANDQISGDKINGGTIGSVTITQLAGALDANNQAITNINVDGGAIDGTTIGANSAAAIAATSIVATSFGIQDAATNRLLVGGASARFGTSGSNLEIAGTNQAGDAKYFALRVAGGLLSLEER